MKLNNRIVLAKQMRIDRCRRREMLRPSIFYWFVVIFLLRMTANMLQFLSLLENTKATHAAFA